MRRRRRGKPVKPVALGAVVTEIYPSKDKGELRAIRAFGWWERAVPERVWKNARPVRIDRGVMLVHTKTSVWANELELLKGDLLRELVRVAPDCGVKKLRVKVGRLPPERDRRKPVRAALRRVPLSQLPEDFARELASVADDEVRRALAEAASTSLGDPET